MIAVMVVTATGRNLKEDSCNYPISRSIISGLLAF